MLDFRQMHRVVVAMSSLLLICRRSGCTAGPLPPTAAEKIAARLAPTGIQPAVQDLSDSDLDVFVLQPSPAAHLQVGVAALGLLRPTDDLSSSTIRMPDAIHALARWDERAVRLQSDLVGSRTLWYLASRDVFIASTSQRAIIVAAGSYEPDTLARSWFVASGNLGPDLSWDRRIKMLGAGTQLILDRDTWVVKSRRPKIEFAAQNRNTQRLGRELDATIHETIGSLSIDPSLWQFPMSGGSDTRAIATSIAKPGGLMTLTWGAPGSEADPLGDAAVARQVAAAVGMPNRFVPIDETGKAPDTVLDAFALASEGRSDHLSGYLDGLALWRSLATQGVSGIIRGDQAFGWTETHTDAAVRRSVEATFLHELLGTEQVLAPIEEAWGRQRWPERLDRRSDETRTGWRDRLYHEYRMPVVLASLTHIKTSFVEVACPLLASPIIEKARQIPDAERTRKRLYRQLIQARLPDIPFSHRGSLPNLQAYLSQPKCTSRLIEVLSDRSVSQVIPPEVSGPAITKLASTSSTTQSDGLLADARRALRSRVPLSVKRKIAARFPTQPSLSPQRLALRLYVVARIHETLAEDANLLRRTQQ